VATPAVFTPGARFLTNADVNGTPRPRARRDVHPRPSRTATPVGQEHPFAIEEAAETEMASVLEEVTAHYAAMVGVAAIETVTFVVS
jgi:hypothetical protein